MLRNLRATKPNIIRTIRSSRKSRVSLAISVLLATGLPAAFAGARPANPPAPTLEQRTDRLIAASDIKKLQRAYGYYIDKGYWQDAADLFADDATFEWGVDGVYVGRARILEYLIRQGGGNLGPGLPFGQHNRHYMLQPVITVSDEKTGYARWRELSMTGEYGKSAHWGDGVYENVYELSSGVWKIKRLRYFPNFIAPYEGGWAALPESQLDWRTNVSKTFPPDRPATSTYLPFPNQFTPPFHYDQGAGK